MIRRALSHASVVVEQGSEGPDALKGGDPVDQDGCDGVGTLDTGGGQGGRHGNFHCADARWSGAEADSSGGRGPDQEDLADREAGDARRPQREGQAGYVGPPVDRTPQ